MIKSIGSGYGSVRCSPLVLISSAAAGNRIYAYRTVAVSKAGYVVSAGIFIFVKFNGDHRRSENIRSGEVGIIAAVGIFEIQPVVA